MSVLSTITSSLPNVLNLLQGKWDVQYKVSGKPEIDSNWLFDFRSIVATTTALLGENPITNAVSKWKSLDFDSFIDMQETLDTDITTVPIEGGSFRSVNKVRKPKKIRITLAKAGIGYGIEDSLNEVKMLLPLARYKDQKAKQYGKGYTGLLSRLLDIAINDEELVKKCI